MRRAEVNHRARLVRLLARRLDRAHPGYAGDYEVSADWHRRSMTALAEAIVDRARVECTGCCDCPGGNGDDDAPHMIHIGEAHFSGSEWDDGDLPEAMMQLAALVAVLNPDRAELVRLANKVGFLSRLRSTATAQPAPVIAAVDASPPPCMQGVRTLVSAPCAP